jgi:integrase
MAPQIESPPRPRKRGRPRLRGKYLAAWEGGFIVRDAKGRQTFIIRKMINGAVFKVSTRCHAHGPAMEQLRRFEANPGSFRVGGTAATAIFLDEELVTEFLHHSKEVKKNSNKWCRDQSRYLGWWQEKLGNRDLRKLTLRDDLAPALKDEPAERQKREVIKALFSWLRTVEHRLTSAEDPALDLLIPQGNSKTRRRENKAFPREHYLGARKHLVGRYRYALDVLAGTGVHGEALARFAAAGRFEKYHGAAEGIAGVLVFPEEKDREEHRVAVTAETLEAAKALRAEGHLHLGRFAKALNLACDAAEVERHSPGRYRHAVGSWAVDAGEDIAAVAAYLGHRSPTTTRKFYATHATPRPVRTV